MTDFTKVAAALNAITEALNDPADRYAVLAWLASPAGTHRLGHMKDAVVVAHRFLHGGTYADTAAQLNISVNAVNAAVSRAKRSDTQDKGDR
jgi:hypothetical protein